MRVAWLGTGLMGRPMALRLLGTGHEVAVWNRTRETMAQLVEAGARPARTPAEAVASAEVVFLMLRDGPTSQAVLLSSQPTPDLSRRSVVQMATVASGESAALGAAVAAAGGRYLEAPVLGSLPQARSGDLLVLAGGDEADFTRLRPLLALLGREPLRVGGVGSASLLKLALNQMIAHHVASLAFSIGLVRRGGGDVELFMKILRQSAFHAPTYDARLPRLTGRDYANPNFPTELFVKDVELMLAEAATRGLDGRALAGIRDLAADAVAAGLGRLDYSSLYEIVDPPTASAVPPQRRSHLGSTGEAGSRSA